MARVYAVLDRDLMQPRLGNLLGRLRRMQRYSVVEAAQAAGVSKTLWDRVEGGGGCRLSSGIKLLRWLADSREWFAAHHTPIPPEDRDLLIPPEGE